MRPPADITEARRIALIQLLETTQGKSDICAFDSFYKIETVHRFIKRLRDAGVRISSSQRFEGKETVYRLDMPVIEAMHLIRPEMTQEEMDAEAARKTENHRRAALKSHKKRAGVHKPIGDFHPWWGIICTPQTIDIGVPSCK